MNEDNCMFSKMVEETFYQKVQAYEKIYQGIYLDNLQVFRFSFAGGVILDFPKNINPFVQLWPKNSSKIIHFKDFNGQQNPFDALEFLMPGLKNVSINWKESLNNQVELSCYF